jgi:hypothetical protein
MSTVDKLIAFGALLDLVRAKAVTLAQAVNRRDAKVPALTQQMRGALEVVHASSREMQKELDAIDGGG